MMPLTVGLDLWRAVVGFVRSYEMGDGYEVADIDYRPLKEVLAAQR